MKKMIYSIGRDEGCDISLWDETNEVSRQHAQIRIDAKGRYWLMDLSTNGTYVNGIKVTPGVEVPVTRKDEINFAHKEDLNWSQIPKPKQTGKIILICVSSLFLIAGVVAVLWFFVYKDSTQSDSTSFSGSVEQVDSANIINRDSVQTPATKKKKSKYFTLPSKQKEEEKSSEKSNDEQTTITDNNQNEDSLGKESSTDAIY